MSRFLKRWLWISLFLSSTYVFFATQMGLKSAVWLVKKIVPGELRVEGLHGKILGSMGCTSFFYQDHSVSLHVSELALDWRLWSLIRKGQLLIDNLKINSVSLTSQGESDFRLPALWKRIKIASFSIQQFSIKTKGIYFKCQGKIDREWQLNWKLDLDIREFSPKSSGLIELAGSITGTWDRYPQLQLMSRSQSFEYHYLDRTQAIQFIIPSFEWQGSWQSTGLSSRILLEEEGSGFIKIFMELPHYQGDSLPKAKQLVRAEAHVNIINWEKLNEVLSQFLPPIFNDLNGILKGVWKCQGSFDHLKKGWQSPILFLTPDQKNVVWPKFFAETAPDMQLDLVWQQPALSKLGLHFDTCSVNARLDRNQVMWNADLKAIKKGEVDREATSVAKWSLNGITKLSHTPYYTLLSKSKTPPRIFTELTLTGDPLPLFHATPYQLVAKPSLRLTAEADRITIGGTVYIPDAQIHLDNETESKAVILDEDMVLVEENTLSELQPAFRYFPPLYTNLKLILGKEVQLYSDGLETYLDGVLKLTGSPHHPLKAWGELLCRSGHYNYYGQILDLEKGSRLIYTEFFDNPKLDIAASKTIWVAPGRGVSSDLTIPEWKIGSVISESKFSSKPIKARVGFRAQGPVNAPYIYLYSNPPELITKQADLLAYLLTGQSSQDLNTANTQLLLEAAYQLSNYGKEKGNLIIELQKKIGLDYLSIQSDPILDPNTHQLIQNTAVVLGKRVTPKLYVFCSIGLLNSIYILKANYFLSRYFSLEGSMSQLNNGIDLLFHTEY